METYESLSEKEKYFKCKTIDNETDLKELINSLKDSGLVYRGVKEAKFKCYTSAQVRTKASVSQIEFDQMISNSIELVRKSSELMNVLKSRSMDQTDFQILSLLQHYGYGTPLLDFSYDIKFALFFASCETSNYPLTDSIDCYFSIYAFNPNDPDHISWQEVLADSIEQIEELDNNAKIKYGQQYQGVSNETKISYSQMPYDEVKKIANGGLTIDTRAGYSYSINSLSGIKTNYDISNVRVDKQSGLFKFVSCSTLPYEIASNKWYSEMKDKLFCYNIHKSLIPFIRENYLTPNNINYDTVYPDDEESKEIKQLLDSLPFNALLKS